MTAAPDRGERRRAGFLPALPRRAWVVLGADFLSAIGSGLTLPCLFIYAHEVRQLSYGAAGLVVSTVALVSLAGNPAGGALADRWTPRRALMAGLVIAAAGSVALALARTTIALFGAAGVLGFGVAVAWPAQDALLASLVSPAARSAVFSVRHASMNAGLALGAFIAAAVVSVAHPATFVAVYLADAASFLVAVPVLACLREPARPAGALDASAPDADKQEAGTVPANTAGTALQTSFRDVLKDRAFVRVWALTALIATVSFGQFQSSFAGYATRPGGVSAHGLSLAFAANMVTVTVASLFVLRWLAGRRRTTGAALAALAWAATWTVVIIGGHLGGVAAEVAFAAAMVIFALGETLLSPTLPAIINDLAPPGAAGRYNGLGALAFTTGFLLGPALGGAALGAGWGTGLFAVLIASCLLASAAALRLGRRLPLGANQVTAPAEATAPEPVPADAKAAAPEPVPAEPVPATATGG
jgi:MFS family permease